MENSQTSHKHNSGRLESFVVLIFVFEKSVSVPFSLAVPVLPSYCHRLLSFLSSLLELVSLTISATLPLLFALSVSSVALSLSAALSFLHLLVEYKLLFH